MDLNVLVVEAVKEALHEQLKEAARPPAIEPRLLRVRDVAAATGLSTKTIRALIARGEIPTRDVEPYNVMLVARTDLDAWVESLPKRRSDRDQKTA